MAKPLSIDLRTRVVRYVLAGYSRRSAAAKFDISVSSAIRLMALQAATGNVRPKAIGGKRHAKLEAYTGYVLERVEQEPDITLPELAQELAKQGVKIHPSSLSRLLLRHGYTYKKNAAGQRTRSARRQGRASGVD